MSDAWKPPAYTPQPAPTEKQVPVSAYGADAYASETVPPPQYEPQFYPPIRQPAAVIFEPPVIVEEPIQPAFYSAANDARVRHKVGTLIILQTINAILCVIVASCTRHGLIISRNGDALYFGWSSLYTSDRASFPLSEWSNTLGIIGKVFGVSTVISIGVVFCCIFLSSRTTVVDRTVQLQHRCSLFFLSAIVEIAIFGSAVTFMTFFGTHSNEFQLNPSLESSWTVDYGMITVFLLTVLSIPMTVAYAYSLRIPITSSSSLFLFR